MAYNIAPSKQDLLVSGTNIKTINNNSLLGSGNLTVSGLPSSVNPTDANKVVAVDSSGVASWQYAGLGSGSFGTDNIILGRAKPTGFAGYTVDNIIINSSSTAPLTSFSGAYNILIGSAGNGQTYQNDNIIIGQLPNTVGNAAASVSIGNALYIANSNYAVTIGRAATSYQEAVTIGYSSYSGNTGAVTIGHSSYSGNTGNVAIGASAVAFGADSISIGKLSQMGSGASNIVIGKSSGKYPSTGANNTIVGTASFTAVTSGSSNTILGAASATALTTGNDNVIVGKSLAPALNTGTNNVIIGSECLVAGTNTTYNVTIGYQCSRVNNLNTRNVLIGYQAGETLNNGIDCVALGTLAGGSGTNTSSAISIGYNAGYSSKNSAICIGRYSGYSSGFGVSAIAIGEQAGGSAGACDNSIAIGSYAANSATSTSSVFLGRYAGTYCTANQEFYLNGTTVQQANTTAEKAAALMYGQFNNTTASQTLTINATTTSTYGLSVSTAGYGISVKSGSNAKIGVTGAFPGGNPNTVTVSTTAVTANSIILVSAMSFTGGLTGAPYVSAITASTSFVITVPDNSFTGTVGWVIIEKA